MGLFDKKFKNTKVGSFLDKAKDVVPGVVLDVITGTSPIKAIGEALKKEAVKGDSLAKGLSEEFYKHELDFESEMYQLEVKDRQDARKREIDVMKLGKFDFMFYLSGITGLASFGFVIYVLVYVELKTGNKELFVHLLGLIEGVALSIFAYYFGSSKGSQEKQKTIDQMK